MQMINFILIYSVLNTEVKNILHEPFGLLIKTMKPLKLLKLGVSS